jgi:hypothetical protein
MSKLPNCEKDSLKSFINILKSYGLDQQRASNIGIAENIRLDISPNISTRARRAFYNSQIIAINIRIKLAES